MYSYSMNRTGDLADLASRTESRLNDMRVKATQAKLRGAGSADCRSCGEPIPEERRKALPSATRCAGCQTDHEHLAKVTGYGDFDISTDVTPASGL